MTIQNDTESLYTPGAEFLESKPHISEEELIRNAVVRLNGHILGFVFGTVAALIIFAATNFLVLKGGPQVGPHLRLLDQFLYGYSVTFLGSLVGAVYLFVIGYACGLFIAWIYNTVIAFRARK
jgi:hypothetical protein